MSNSSLEKIIDDLPTLPSMPNIIFEALAIIGNPKSSIRQLSKIISKDLSITTEILKMVNSAYYGFPSQITTINQAMALLGLDNVRGVIFGAATKPMLTTYSGRTLWIHSIRCAVGCQLLSKGLGMGNPDEAFVVGLLHDVGKTVMEIYDRNRMKELTRLCNMGADQLYMEQTMFGFLHTEAGAALASKWKLPQVIIDCIRYHHNPQDADGLPLAQIVYVANCLTQEKEVFPMIDPEIAEYLEFEITNPSEMREQIFQFSETIVNALEKK
jgi:putative nucleotidyltransferase with HDIG domain